MKTILGFELEAEALKEATNCTFLDMEGNPTALEAIQLELEQGYRVGVVLQLVPEVIQLITVIATPYRQDGDEIDGGFLIDVYNRYVMATVNDEALCLSEANEADYFLGEAVQ